MSYDDYYLLPWFGTFGFQLLVQFLQDAAYEDARILARDAR